MMDGRPMDRSKGNNTVKGCMGKNKRYYTGKHRKSKKHKKTLCNFGEGDTILYESGGRLFKAVIETRNDDNEFVVKPDAGSTDRRDIVSDKQSPHKLTDLQLTNDEIAEGLSVLVTWQIVDGGFVELVPAQIVDIQDAFCWTKPGNGDGFIRVGHDEMCKT